MPMSDKEQIQLFKDWWKQYGGSILFAIVAFAVVNFCWHYWQHYKYQRLEHASITYTQLLSALEQQKNDEAQLLAKRLQQNFARSPYASLATLLQAKLAVQTGDLNTALEKLQWIIANSHENSIKQIARIRAARVLLANKKPQAALDLLTQVDDGAFVAASEEARGDALLALGKTAEAKNAYDKAKQATPADAKSPLLSMKLQQF